MSEMGWDKEESGVERNNVGSASEAAPEPVKAFLARTGIQTWGFGDTPKPSLLCLLCSRAHSGCSLGIQGIISAPKPTGHRKGDRTMQLWAQKQPGTLGCAKGSSQGTGGTPERELTPSYPQPRENHVGLPSLVLAASGCLDGSG